MTGVISKHKIRLYTASVRSRVDYFTGIQVIIPVASPFLRQLESPQQQCATGRSPNGKNACSNTMCNDQSDGLM